jgi:hypothetical protein
MIFINLCILEQLKISRHSFISASFQELQIQSSIGSFNIGCAWWWQIEAEIYLADWQFNHLKYRIQLTETLHLS